MIAEKEAGVLKYGYIYGTASIGSVNPLRYCGYYYDSETGFYYLGSRYYDPVNGRFLNADTTEVLIVSTALADKNLYSYCDNNPVIRVDVDGEIWVTVFTAMALQYLGDVLENIANEKTGADIFKPTSSGGEYVAAAFTAFIPGSNIVAVVKRSIVTEGIRCVEMKMTGVPNTWSESLGRITGG